MSPLIHRKPGRPKVQGLAELRREQILAAATEEFARRGFAGTDLQVVANRLDVGKGTVYRYFRAKEALFLAAVDRGMRLLTERTNAAASRALDPRDPRVPGVLRRVPGVRGALRPGAGPVPGPVAADVLRPPGREPRAVARAA